MTRRVIPGGTNYGIICDAAQVAAAQTPCIQCGERMEVICIRCRSGTETETDESMTQFTVSNISNMDDALAAQLEAWPNFKRIESGAAKDMFANHCPHCGAAYEDFLLHDEPGDVFFALPRTESRGIRMITLKGRVRLTGDYSLQL